MSFCLKRRPIEADPRIFLHVTDAVNHGCCKIVIRAVDTDVFILAITAAQQLTINELWLAFGAGKNFRYFPAHEIARALGPEKSIALPFAHAFSGCDTVSCFAVHGKKSVWETWNIFNEITSVICILASTPDSSSITDQLEVLECFVVLLYDRTSTEMTVNAARKQLFSRKKRLIDNLPPTQATLIEPRAAYQSGHIWAQMFVPAPTLPSPSEWGWTQTSGGGWEVKWTSLSEASQACRELLRCGCKKGCRNE